jgi:hypothetical protein
MPGWLSPQKTVSQARRSISITFRCKRLQRQGIFKMQIHLISMVVVVILHGVDGHLRERLYAARSAFLLRKHHVLSAPGSPASLAAKGKGRTG